MSWRNILTDAWRYADKRGRWSVFVLLALLALASILLAASEASLITPYLYPLF
jgi:hypothetical protein